MTIGMNYLILNSNETVKRKKVKCNILNASLDVYSTDCSFSNALLLHSIPFSTLHSHFTMYFSLFFIQQTYYIIERQKTLYVQNKYVPRKDRMFIISS